MTPNVTITPIATVNNVTSYRMVDAKGEASAVTVFRWDEDDTVNAHCMRCDAYKCVHADTVLRHHRSLQAPEDPTPTPPARDSA